MSVSPSSSHSARTDLHRYIARLHARIRVNAWLRGAAILTAAALLTTVALVLILNRYAFPAHAVIDSRIALIAVLVLTAALALLWPISRLSRTLAVARTERLHPDLAQRLTTFQEREAITQQDAFVDLLAADTLTHTQHIAPSTLAPAPRLLAFASAGLASAALLIWLINAAPGFLGYGSSLLWTGARNHPQPLYAITVAPGDVAVRRNSDQLITAQIKGMNPAKVQLFAHYQSSPGWEPVAMQATPESAGSDDAAFHFLFAGLPESVEYYVAAGPLTSAHYKVRVVDLPAVKSIQVTYRYPAWTGLKPVTEEHSGDLRAIEGTDAAIAIETDKPLQSGMLTLDSGQKIQLTAAKPATANPTQNQVQPNRYTGTIHMQKDGAYHLAALDQGQSVRLSEDFFIATDKAQPPQVAIDRPGRDYRASPIEEVTIGVKAADTFGLNDVHLHYSVNAGPDHDINLLKEPRAHSSDGSYTLRLEDFKLVPGDLVSLYATARDGHAEARTDISFIQAEPFEREFSQSQQSGGGGDGGGGGPQNSQTEISKREKELIAQTWKQHNDKTASLKDAAVAGQFLADAQKKLRDQVLALSNRIESRDLSEANEEFTGFEKDIRDAAAAMAPSADKLKATQWTEALPLEQKALQSLMRAEATFRKIQVAFGQQGGGGAGGVGGAGRDLASLFDLELDTAKNQYETAQTASPAEQHQKDVESALEKLDALAKRQEELAAQRPNPQQSFEQRWQQEMLRREAEQLQRQMEQLAQNNQGQSQQGGKPGSSSGQQSGQSSSGQSGSQQQSGQQPGSQPARASGSQSGFQSSDQQRIQDSVSRLRQATEAMKRSAGPTQGPAQNPTQNADAAKQAADRLRDATNLLGGAQQHLATGKMDSLSRQADQLVEQQRAQSERIDKLASQSNSSSASSFDQEAMRALIAERNRLAAERQQLSNGLSGLQKGVRDAAREMAPTQPGVAKNLRDALTEMDQADLDNHVQRTADWLRRGVNPNSNGTEAEIAKGLQKLDQQLHQAQQGMGSGNQPGQSVQRSGATSGDASAQSAALGQVERLRRQIEYLSSQSGQGNGQRAGNAQLTTNNKQPTTAAANSGDTRNGGAGAGGPAWNNVNTGNNRYGADAKPPAPGDVPLTAAGNPADTERTYQQSLRELNQLRQLVGPNPRATAQVNELTRQMQRLDPSRFPGNPALVEQMHREVLSAVDRLELQLNRSGDGNAARTGKPLAVPPGYQDSVADYYKRLSSKP